MTRDDCIRFEEPIPKPTKLRREMQRDGGYSMVPAYTVEEVKALCDKVTKLRTVCNEAYVVIAKLGGHDELLSDIFVAMEGGVVTDSPNNYNAKGVS